MKSLSLPISLLLFTSCLIEVVTNISFPKSWLILSLRDCCPLLLLASTFVYGLVALIKVSKSDCGPFDCVLVSEAIAI
jgi:hypothetical protein